MAQGSVDRLESGRETGVSRNVVSKEMNGKFDKTPQAMRLLWEDVRMT